MPKERKEKLLFPSPTNHLQNGKATKKKTKEKLKKINDEKTMAAKHKQHTKEEEENDRKKKKKIALKIEKELTHTHRNSTTLYY